MASSLPEDILIEICSRLPAKSVGRFRSLCKQWNSCLSTSQFIKSHVRHKNHPQNLILVREVDGEDHSCEVLTVSAPVTDDVSSEYTFLSRKNPVRVMGSVDGLVLLQCDGYGMHLINPVTHELGENKIPSPPTFKLKEYGGKKQNWNLDTTSGLPMLYGFGYDSSTDDYKIVVGGYYVEDEHDWRRSASCALFLVYSVKLGVWTSVTSPYIHIGTHVHVFSHGVFVNGAIHWLAGDLKGGGYYAASRILAFSLADEVIHEIPAPPDVLVDVYQQHSLSVLGGCLCVISCNVNSGFGRINVWVMKQYGSVASWTSFCVNTRNKWVVDVPLCFTDDNEIVFINKGDCVVTMYHFEKETMKEMAVDGDLAVFNGGCTFSGSLVSPNQATLVDDQMNAERKRKRKRRRKGLKRNNATSELSL